MHAEGAGSHEEVRMSGMFTKSFHGLHVASGKTEWMACGIYSS